jgi:DNA invertase Pin-like site-specific DNA recombinase
VPLDKTFTDKLDRLARNMSDLETLVRNLTSKGVTVEFVNERLTFTGADDKYATLLLHILGGVAQFERSIIRERQREGIALAKARGAYKGRKPSLTPDRVTAIRKRVEAGEKIAALSRELKVSRQTLYQHLSQ